MDWRVKALAFKTLACIPGSVPLVDFYRIRFGKMAHFAVSRRFRAAELMLEMVRRSGVNLERARCLEIGAGWQPTLPVILHLAGARDITLTDIKGSLTERTVSDAVHQYQGQVDRLAEMTGRSSEEVRDFLERLASGPDRSWRESFAAAGIQYHAPLDLSRDDPPGGPFDLIYSNSVLTFIPAPVLKGIIKRSRRLVSPGGVCCHNITIGDEFHGADGNITTSNFLRYSAKQWRFWGQNRLKHQNRLRPSDYVRIFENAGFVVEACDIDVDETLLPRLDELGIHPDFQDYPPRELAAIHARIIARPRT
jgi:hypothetical protein